MASSSLSCSQLSTATIARLMMSAAVPCMGALIAVRSAPLRMAWFFEWISGRYRRRPKRVSTKPCSAALARVDSI
ncbi:hypothetical protein D3C77_742330 [compost metagenome]